MSTRTVATNVTVEPNYFKDAEEILELNDRAETDVTITAWDKSLRIRALSFADMEWINQQATNKETGKLDHAEWTYLTLHKGVIRPLINTTQARKLGEKNGTAVNELAENIWQLSRVSKKAFDEYIEKLQDLSQEEKIDEEQEEKRKKAGKK